MSRKVKPGKRETLPTEENETSPKDASGHQEIPNWAKETSPDLGYFMYVYDDYDGSREEIRMSRREYIGLKGVLAGWRGYPSTAGGSGAAQA